MADDASECEAGRQRFQIPESVQRVRILSPAFSSDAMSFCGSTGMPGLSNSR